MPRGKSSAISALFSAVSMLGANLDLNVLGFCMLKPTLVRDSTYKGNVLLYESEWQSKQSGRVLIKLSGSCEYCGYNCVSCRESRKVDSEEDSATIQHAIPPASGYRLRLLCTHRHARGWTLLSWLESPILASLQRLREQGVTYEEAFPLLTAPPGSLEGRSSWPGQLLLAVGEGSCLLSYMRPKWYPYSPS